MQTNWSGRSKGKAGDPYEDDLDQSGAVPVEHDPEWHFGTNWTTYYDYPSFARSDLAQQIWADEDARRDPDMLHRQVGVVEHLLAEHIPGHLLALVVLGRIGGPRLRQSHPSHRRDKRLPRRLGNAEVEETTPMVTPPPTNPRVPEDEDLWNAVDDKAMPKAPVMLNLDPTGCCFSSSNDGPACCCFDYIVDTPDDQFSAVTDAYNDNPGPCRRRTTSTASGWHGPPISSRTKARLLWQKCGENRVCGIATLRLRHYTPIRWLSCDVDGASPLIRIGGNNVSMLPPGNHAYAAFAPDAPWEITYDGIFYFDQARRRDQLDAVAPFNKAVDWIVL
ncbi:hypothetical protein AK812_SmicGene31806 [Symbiodinium microadriaticum]|uniref:Uncharacterized protein n=1 Tax=Symbiodinium microadriaticum TaxID=2951 RepID=A0A1Q9CVS4_SYMMI|nr:hypothetical protein AK812_SmicGene31806 [Symbiodinium microadriaticum]